MLSVTAVRKSFGAGRGLQPISFTVPRGETLVLLGATGSGKSTVLRIIAGLETPDAGEVTVAGTRIDRLAPHRRGVAFVPQRPVLYPDLTVAENLAVRGANAAAGIELLRLEGLLSRRPHELSGGELQRVALASLVARPTAVWLLDEPFSGLDVHFRTQFRADLHLLAATQHATMVIVTHDPADAWAFGHQVGVLDSGVLRQLGPAAELAANPVHRAVLTSFGQAGCLTGRVGGGGPSGAAVFASDCGAVRCSVPTFASEPGTRIVDNLTLGLRPEDVLARPANAPADSTPGVHLTGWRVSSAEPDGSGWRLVLSSPGDNRVWLKACQPAGSPPPVGTSTDWFVPARLCLWFATPTGRRLPAQPDTL